MILFLTGMPGAGKTTLGKRWAMPHHFSSADLDAMIAASYGAPVADIFRQEGEDAFRLLERQVLEAAVNIHVAGGLIIACGGGTPCYHNNTEWMKRHGTVIWLQVPVHVLTEQIWNDTHNKRPLLLRYTTKAALHGHLDDLLALRQPYYMQADHEIEVNDKIDSKFVALLNQLGYKNE